MTVFLQITKETFQNHWVRTGDVGFYDENGFIYVKDRVKEIFKYFNNHVRIRNEELSRTHF